ncbi:MAG: FG-GAP repeat protein [Thiolinea sp.]
MKQLTKTRWGLSGLLAACWLMSSPVHALVESAPVNSTTVQPGEVPEGLNAGEWADIRRQIRMGRYKAFDNEQGGYKSANPRQGFHIDYGADGMTTLRPYDNQDAYRIGMRLDGVGYSELEAVNATPLALHSEEIGKANGSQVSYVWSENVTEWWVNQEDRLEQWFRLREAPQGKVGDEPLRLRLALDTDMQTRIQPQQLTFSKGSQTVNYDKFKAWDATGKALDVHFAGAGRQLELVIADAGAVYPLTIDPTVSQAAYIKASNTGAFDQFGWSVSLYDNTLAVGAYNEDSNATGINGDQTNNSASNSGAVYVFVRNGTTWTQEAYIKASNTGSVDGFGFSVSVYQNTLAVGAGAEDSNATGINGDQTNNLASAAGAVYVFVRSGTTWTQEAYIKASNTNANDGFGFSVSVYQNTLAVGAGAEESNATGINGDQTNNLASAAGAVYVFVRSGTTWTQEAYIKASNTEAFDEFGQSVSLYDNTLVVGAVGEESNTTGINGDQTNNLAPGAGAVYVFVRSGTTWTQEAYIKASNADADDFLVGQYRCMAIRWRWGPMGKTAMPRGLMATRRTIQHLLLVLCMYSYVAVRPGRSKPILKRLIRMLVMVLVG